MTINSLRDALHAVPFKPFTIYLADRRSVPVPHPDFITVTGAGRTAIVADQTEDRFTIIDLFARDSTGDWEQFPRRESLTLSLPFL